MAGSRRGRNLGVHTAFVDYLILKQNIEYTYRYEEKMLKVFISMAWDHSDFYFIYTFIF